MRSSRLILYLLWALAAFGQAQPAKLANVSGVVVNSVTGEPLPRAHVSFETDKGESRTYGAMTGADGKFSIIGMVPGSYTPTLERIGFSMPSDARAPENNSIEFMPDEMKTDLRLQLVPSGAITGIVTNAEGEPVEGTSVFAELVTGNGVNRSSATTDAKGHFRIGGLAPGSYRVRARPENSYAPAELRTDGTFDQQDGPTSWGPHVKVIPGGESSGVDIRLTQVPIIAVSGKLEGGPAGGFNQQLWLASADGGGRSTAGVKPDGSFRLWRLYPGKYEVSAFWQAPGGREFRSGPVTFEVAGTNIEHLTLRIVSPSDMAGHVEFQDEAAKPAPGAVTKLALVSLGLQGVGKSVDVSADGSFQIAQLRAGKYRVIPQWRNSWVASMQSGPVSMDGSVLDLSNGAPGPDLSIRVKAATSGISGNVSDERGPAAGVRVVLAFDGADGGIRPRSTTSGAGGTYSFPNVAPGKYKIVAVPNDDNDYAVQSGRLDEYADRMESIEVHPDEKLSRDLKRLAPEDK